jgi:DNA (cytosine-5)-methyltransferase 1
VRGLIVDSFAGGGGASFGIEQALGRSPDIAINHDAEAIAMHAANHPSTRHYCGDVWEVDPIEACGGRPVDLAWFSPDCKHFSKAKGGKPVDKKIRGLAWRVIDWARDVRPAVIFLENVEEFQTWGPLTEEGKPDPSQKGETYREWLRALESLGYAYDTRPLRACDYGAPTTRKRFFLIARCDGKPIVWPTPTHGPGRKLAHRVAAECMDWALPCPSIFDRVKPLAEKTQARIARGVHRYVINANDPFIVPTSRGPMSPTLIQTGYGERPTQAPRSLDLNKPMGTIVAGGVKHALVATFLARHYGGNENDGASLTIPMHTITCQDHHALVACAMGSGQRVPEVRSFLTKFPGPSGLGVTVNGEAYEIADIGMRMLVPRELFRAQGFPDSYVIDPVVDGSSISKTAQVRMAGNSVCPPLAEAIVRANCADLVSQSQTSVQAAA